MSAVQSQLGFQYDPPTQRVPIIILNAVFCPLMTFVVLIRFYVRLFLTHSVGYDDYTCGIAAILTWIQAGLMLNATHIAMNVMDITSLPMSSLRWITSATIPFPAIMMTIKVSILLLYYRIFKLNRRLRNVIVGSIVVILLANILWISFYIYIAMVCVDLRDVLNAPLCQNKNYSVYLASRIFTVVTDFWLLFLPMPSVLKLHLDKRRKWGLVAVFGTATITCVMSFFRTIYYSQTSSLNPLWIGTLTSEMTVVESNLGIIVACSPILPKFYTSTRAYTVSAYQSFTNRGSRLDSLVGKSKASNPGSGDGSEERITNVKEYEQSSATGQSQNIGYPLTQPILRTDSFEVVYSVYHQ